MEAAVEAGEGQACLEGKGWKAELKVEAGDGREGDAESGGEGFVELDLELGAVGGEWRGSRFESAWTATAACQRR